MDKDGPVFFEGNYDGFKEYLAARDAAKASARPLRERPVNVGAEVRKLENEIDAKHRKIESLRASQFEERVWSDRAEYDRVSAQIASLEAEADACFAKIAELTGD